MQVMDFPSDWNQRGGSDLTDSAESESVILLREISLLFLVDVDGF